jgi:antitoxin ParD1/3/4
MVNLNVSLTEAQRDWIEAQVKGGRYGNLSEYVRELIRIDQTKAAERRLEELLLEGLNSGEPVEVTPEFWEQKRRDLVARVEEARKQKKKAS